MMEGEGWRVGMLEGWNVGAVRAHLLCRIQLFVEIVTVTQCVSTRILGHS